MKKNLFILLFGHGRSGTSAVRGFLSLSPDINMAFEENLMILQDDNKKIYAVDDGFSFDYNLAKRVLSDECNGNKIILGPHFISAERIIECIERKVVITNASFSELKVLFVNRNKKDLINSIKDHKGSSLEWATDNWKQNEKELKILKDRFDHFSFDFYKFIKGPKLREDVFKFLELDFSKSWNNKEVDTLVYGIKKLSVSNLSHYSVKAKPKAKIKKKARIKKSK